MTYEHNLIRWAKRRAAIKRLIAAGMKTTEVAARMKISRQRVYQIMASKND